MTLETHPATESSSLQGSHLRNRTSACRKVPRVVDAVDLPVIAAGGIADGRGIAAVLSLGADGAWLGTRFVATEEAAVVSGYSERIVAADETDTFYGELFDQGWPGMPHRVLRNSTVEKWKEAGRPAPGDRPGEDDQLGTYPNGQSVERYGDDVPVDGMDGETEAMALYAGQSTGGIEAVQPAATVVDELVKEAQDTIESVGR